jgi:hypothetical protein
MGDWRKERGGDGFVGVREEHRWTLDDARSWYGYASAI